MEEEIKINNMYQYLFKVIKHLLLNLPLEPLQEENDYVLLYHLAKAHELTSITYYGIKEYLPSEINKKWEDKVNQKIFKSLAQLEEKEKINTLFNEANIKHCFLKGCYLKTIYPEHDYREMSDIDVLIKKNDLKKAHDILVNKLSYKNESNLGSHHQTYLKKPVHNIELHYELIDDEEKQFAYFSKYSNELFKQDQNEIKMDINDYFIYFIFHAYHHFSIGGIGIRHIIDLYILLEHEKNNLNFDYINPRLKELEIDEFYSKCLKLTNNIFYNENNEDLETFYQTIISSGTYGTIQNRVKNEMSKTNESKIKYLFKRLFPSPKKMKTIYPTLKKHPLLLPFYYLSRPFRLIGHWKNAKEEINDTIKYKKD